MLNHTGGTNNWVVSTDVDVVSLDFFFKLLAFRSRIFFKSSSSNYTKIKKEKISIKFNSIEIKIYFVVYFHLVVQDNLYQHFVHMMNKFLF